jgi:hypothetical protein
MIHPLTLDAENTSEWDDWLMPGVALSQPFTDPPGLPCTRPGSPLRLQPTVPTQGHVVA